MRSGCAAATAAAAAASAAATTAVAPGKCESRVTAYGALEYARGLPPLSHNPGSWRNKAGSASATGAANHARRLEMGGTVSRTREGFAAQQRQCGRQ